MQPKLKAGHNIVLAYRNLFVNRLAYTVQSPAPHSESGRHYYFRPKRKDQDDESVPLSLHTLRRHLEGGITIGLYAINPKRSAVAGSPLMPITRMLSKTC